MNVQGWGIVVGLASAVLLALGPWMVMVAVKLAVLTTKVDEIKTNDLEHVKTKLDELVKSSQHRLKMCLSHDADIKQLKESQE